MCRMRNALAGASALALLALPGVAQAQAVSGLVEGAYSASEVSNVDVDAWSFGGQLVLNFMNGFNAQGGVNYNSLDGDVDTWTFNGGAFYRGMQGAVGAQVSYSTLDVGGVDFDSWTYGVLGELYVSPMVTLLGNVSMVDGDGSEGWNIGGGARVYAMPNLAIGAGVGHTDIDGGGDSTAFSVGGEFLPINTTPVTLFAGYTQTDVPGDNVDTWMVGLRFYFGGAGSLVDIHRSNALRSSPF